MPNPHGGELINRFSPNNKIEKIIEESKELTNINVDLDLRNDLENIACGLFSPLEGPMICSDYESVLEKGRLQDGVPWTIPILMDTSKKEMFDSKEGDYVAVSNEGETFAILYIEDLYKLDRKKHSYEVYGTLESDHPGIIHTRNMKSILVGGKINLFKESTGKYSEYRLKPLETRFLFKEKNWRTIAGFQTRNAPHIGHEFVQKTSLSFIDGLLINPLIGRKKKGDFKDQVILEAYNALMKNYFLSNSVVLVTLEMPMRYAGPREAIFHAILRKNYGCTHFIVGRDHAGVGNYYGPYESQEKFDEYPDLGIIPLFFKSFHYCKKCVGPQSEKICPHGESERLNYSGTNIRKMLQNNERPPVELMRSEVVDVILKHKEPFVN